MKTKGKSNCPRKKEKKEEINWSIAACVGRTYIEAIPMPKLMNVCQHPDTPSTCQNHHEIDSWLYQIVAKQTPNPNKINHFFETATKKDGICMT